MGTFVGVSPDLAKVSKRSSFDPEFPLFCEKCGYQLCGSSPVTCDCCELHYFCCPECGHHQPINTLRPVLQKGIASVRATGLQILVQIKLAIVVPILCDWGDFSAGWVSFDNYYDGGRIELRDLAPVCFNAMLTGLLIRLLVVWWTSSIRVGLIWSSVVMFFMIFGIFARMVVLQLHSVAIIHSPWTFELVKLLLAIGSCVLAGTIFAQPIWRLAVWLFLPRPAWRWLAEVTAGREK